MSKDYLPYKIDPFKSAAHETKMQGHLKIQDMPRLRPSLHSDEGDVELNMVFGMDEQGTCIIRGHLKTSVVLQCQRCMKPFKYEILSDFILGVINNEEEVKDLPEGYTPVIAVDGVLEIKDMIEDELIVDLPIVPMHDPDGCNVKLPFETGDVIEENNPFKVISILMSKQSKEEKSED